MNIEQEFLTQLIVQGDLALVTDLGIKPRFLSGKFKRAFKYIQEHQTKFGKVPSKLVFKKKFPSLALSKNDEGEIGTDESLEFWCEELRTKKKHNTLVDNTEKILDHIENLETDEAYSIFKSTVIEVENEVIQSDCIKINENTSKRWDEYKERQMSGGVTGLPSGIEEWDKLIGGYNDGELITCMGYTGLGKSWWEIIQGVHIAKEGYRVLLFTTEMATKMVFRRIDAVWCELNYSEFKKGQLKTDQEKRYKEYLESIEGDTDANLIVEQATGGISQISAKIDQHKPDIVFIDGAYLLEDEVGGEDNHAGILRIWNGLHKLALNKHLPIVVTTQSKDETGATLKSMNFAKALSTACDVIVVLEQDQQMRYDKEILMKPLKLREGDILYNVMLNWDFNEMDYSCIYKERQAEDVPIGDVDGVIKIA